MFMNKAPLDSKFTLLYENSYSSVDPRFSVIVPVFNQEAIIGDVLNSILDSMELGWELIVIDDSSEDKSAEIILEWVKGVHPNSSFQKVRIYSSQSQQLETACDAFGISKSLAPFAIEVQADMLITDKGFDRRLELAFDRFPNLAMISGRGVESYDSAFTSFISKGGVSVSRAKSPWLHTIFTAVAVLSRNLLKHRKLKNGKHNNIGERQGNWKSEIFPNTEDFLKFGRAGRLGSLISVPIHQEYIPKKIWLGETVMRGPLAIRLSMFEELGGFKTDLYFLGYDDHDLSLRFGQIGYNVGFHPISFFSPEDWGSARRTRTLASEWILNLNFHRKFKRLTKSATWQSVVNRRFPSVRPRIESLEG